MNIHVASKGGFCFGVKKAVDTAVKISESNPGKKIYTYGPIIHNKHVVEMLSEKGVYAVDEIDGIENSIIIIRSHGIPYDLYKKLSQNSNEIIDTTCIFVRKVQNIAKDHYNQGYKILIIGDENHPEIIGINGWCENNAVVIKSLDEVDSLPFDKDDRICIVSQTTLKQKLWSDLIEKIKKIYNNLEIFNTICSATKDRQDEVENISKQVEYMIVVGGKNSSNTQKLYQISLENQKNSIHIESIEDLPMNIIKKYDNIGIVAGASTPDWIIKDVVAMIQNEGEVIVDG